MDYNNKKTGTEMTAEQAITLIDLADYQEGSVVSRTVIDKETGIVTFFAFDEGQGLSEHTAPFDALVYLLDGEPCPDCSELLDYATSRLDKCPLQEDKPTCAKCPIHCYKPFMREKIRNIRALD